MAREESVVDRVSGALGLFDLPRRQVRLLLQLVGLLVVLLVGEIVLLRSRQLMQ